MWDKICKWIDENRDYGVTFFFAYDPISKKPSITLFMAYIAFWVSVISLVSLHFDIGLLVATGMSFLFTAMMVVFYLIRSINKAKFDLDDKSFSVEGEGEENEETK